MKSQKNGESGSHIVNVEGGLASLPKNGLSGELMKNRVRDILLVSSMYDAFTLEEDGLLADRISGEYRAMSLSSSPPNITRVDNCELALEELRRKSYDMIITMARLADKDPYVFGKEAKQILPGLAVILLLTDPAEVPRFYRPGRREGIDKTFYWSGDSSLFFALTKYVEDMMNTQEDARNGFVRVLLVVEDSPKYYSMFLPILYKEIMLQTHALIAEGLNEHEKTFRKRARPKIVLAETYEEAVEYFGRYRENILGVITDVTYTKGGEELEDAGFRFISEIGEGVPVLVQSSDEAHTERAVSMGAKFIGKQSDKLLRELRAFFKESLGFGNFIFRSPEGDVLGTAMDLKEFISLLETVPVESVIHHAKSNHFSNWLMARGEIGMAMQLRPKRVSDFRSDEEIREYLARSFRTLERDKRKGVITDFHQQNFESHDTFTRLGGGSLGGKGRGLAFLYGLFAQKQIDAKIPECRVRIPDTLVIGTEVYDRFMESNGLRNEVFHDATDSQVKDRFLEAHLPEDILSALRKYLSYRNVPLAVRSSSLLEDSAKQPLAGIYSTFMLPNNCPELDVRLSQLTDAIRLIYASVFSRSAHEYIHNTVHSTEEEKMAIVIQNVVGNRHGDSFYPIFSGVAQTQNFYPVHPLKREGGLVTVALGLGKTVVEGQRALSFSPTNPAIIPGFSSVGDILQNSQNHFYALDLGDACHDLRLGDDATLLKRPIPEAEPDGTLDYVASTIDAADQRIRDGTGSEGTRVITFSGVLKYDMLPLNGVISRLLDFGSEGMGMPVEMEFALMMDESGKPEFNVLQIRPQVSGRDNREVTVDGDDIENALVHSTMALGNGLLPGIRDVVFVDPEKFDNTKTQDIAREIGQLNDAISRPYVLIGPGRWGTKDRFLGIPVEWREISWARTIVEVGLDGFRIDPSQGAHFFHNVTSLGIMYFTVPFGSEGGHVHWEWLSGMKPRKDMGCTAHLQLPYELEIKVDGRTGVGIITKKS